MKNLCSVLDYRTVDIGNDDELVILDQTLLPGEIRLLRLCNPEEIWDAIKQLKVRGAPAIGIAAAIGAYASVKRLGVKSSAELVSSFKGITSYLRTSRPTAVNLFWAMDRMDSCADKNAAQSIDHLLAALRKQAVEMMQQDIEVCHKIGQLGLSLLKDGDGILTHCNAGQLATVKYGTATAPIYLAKEAGLNVKVFADETRPLLQGARLTSFELHSAGADVTLICDNMASTVMKNGWIQAIFVGCDRVAANGDTANKIGTSGVAVLAKHYGIPFYICAPTSTIDLACSSGKNIMIEERSEEEITEMWYENRMAPQGVKVYNPAFDVTDNELITAIITENGIARAPFINSLPLVL
ncbi:MAG TPA: S-methyl-5-thioribose-1-phosphate isomerase [Ruminiclostridium sp.]|nr:S-methyl-5-thioribose-1-phosphate isomerase [Ruminiclostridium sp.]